MKALLVLLVLSITLPARAQNVLLVIMDDVGPQNVGAYNVGPLSVGGTPPPTPNMDALALSGVRFRSAWSAPNCTPTRCNIQTGKFGFRTGVGTTSIHGGGELSIDEVLLPELAAEVNYPCALFGKYHLNTPDYGDAAPNLFGFTYFSGHLIGQLPSYFDWPHTLNGATFDETGYATSVNVDDAIAWMNEQTSPFICIVAFNASHAPFHKPPANLHSFNLAGKPASEYPVLHYKAAIEAMDTELGRLLASTPNLAGTHVIVVGDNGTPTQVCEPPFDPLHAKGTVYEGGVNVPLIISGPAVVGDRDVLAPVHVVDLFATVCNLIGADSSTGIDSVNLMPLLLDTQSTVRSFNYTETFSGGDADTGQSAYRNEQYKVILTPTSLELYDVNADPLELSNLNDADMLPEEVHARVSLSCALRALRNSGLCAQCLGDMNCDGVVDGPDAPLFVTALVTPADFPSECPIDNADMNDDNVIDADDVVLFVNLLL